MPKGRVWKVDVDFEHTKRELVLNYVAQKYGEENVCHIVTFGTEKARTSIRDVARVLNYPPSVGAKLAKMVPEAPKMTLTKAMELSSSFAEAYQTDPDAKRIIDIAMRLEGCKRHSSQHACFAPDTLVTTKTGKKRISTIQKGEEVLTHRGNYKPVVATMVTKTADIYTLNLSNGSVLKVTGNHPLLWAKEQPMAKDCCSWRLEWCEVKFLQVGDAVCAMDEAGMEIVHITRKEELSEKTQSMYNLSVLDDNSYVANSIVAHNCGFIVAPGKVDEWLPTSMEKDEAGNKAITAQVTMSEAEELGLLKMDFLGLKNMTVIHDVINAIKETRGINTDYHDIPMNDRETYQMLAKGLTGGVFQLESPGMTRIVSQMLEDVDSLPESRLEECFERMIAAVALYRPGPMAYIPDYIQGVAEPKSVVYDHEKEEPILKNTYGVLVYQEQLMQIAQALAGYSMGEADILRKACGKKKEDVMAKEQTRFIYGNKKDYDAGKAKHYVPGCVNNGVSEETALLIWGKMKKFAEYAFNKSHAACYAYIAVITAYMACHWAPEFYAAMMNAFLENSEKLRNYLGQAVKRHIKLLPPDINESHAEFYAASHDSIRFGLRGIKGVNSIAEAIDAEREANGPFADLQDFYQRMCDAGHNPSSAVMDSLVAAGAFGFVSANKKALMKQAVLVAEQYAWRKKHMLDGQSSLFGDAPLAVALPADITTSDREALDMEMKHTGLYITGHPADALRSMLGRDHNLTTIIDLPATEGRKVSVVGAISKLDRIITRKGDTMYRLTLSDQYSDTQCIVFPSRVEPNRHVLLEGAVVKAIGRYETSEDYDDQFIIQDMVSEQEISAKHDPSVRILIENANQQTKLLAFIKENPGNTKVIIKTGEKLYYPQNLGINLGTSQLDFLQSNFKEVTPI